MRLLFDENLSPKLPGLLAEHFPGSAHVRECGLIGQDDGAVWDYARALGYTIIPKDSDFQQRSLPYGQPPKVVWLRIGNCNRSQILQLIVENVPAIRELCTDPVESSLVLW